MNRSRIKPAWRESLAALGPGILFAGAAIGVSHLVQSTRAGAGYGFDLLWAVVLAMVLKYPFFEFSHRYTVATGRSLLQGYRELGTWALALFMLIVALSSFITIAAVTIVTAGLLGALLQVGASLVLLSLGLFLLVMGILGLGRYRLLDGMMKVMVAILALLTLIAVAVAVRHGPVGAADYAPASIWTVGGLTFLLALMGWMPAPIDIAVWPSLWILEKGRGRQALPSMGQARLDFNVGYVGTGVLAVAFVSFGALVMFGTGREFSAGGLAFARQLIQMYTTTFGQWSRWLIALVAFITMFSTTLTCLDGYARTLAGGVTLLWRPAAGVTARLYAWFLPVLAGLALAVIAFFLGSMRALVDLATVLAFLTAPLVAWLNFRVVRSPQVPADHRPGPALTVLSGAGIFYLAGFSLVWLYVRWLS